MGCSGSAIKDSGDEAWSDDEAALPEWSLCPDSHAVPHTHHNCRSLDPYTLCNNKGPNHELTFYHHLSTVWADSTYGDAPEFPVLQGTLASQEVLEPQGQFMRTPGKNWQDVHQVLLSAEPTVEGYCTEPHWLNREFSEHVTSCLGLALTEMLDRQHPRSDSEEPPASAAPQGTPVGVGLTAPAEGAGSDPAGPEGPRRSGVELFFAPEFQMNQMCVSELLETVKEKLPMSSEMLIVAMIYVDMLNLSSPRELIHPDCINCVLICATLMASKVFDAGSNMFDWGEHNQKWGRIFRIPVSQLKLIEMRFLETISWSLNVRVQAFAHYRARLTRGALLRGILETVDTFESDSGVVTQVVRMHQEPPSTPLSPKSPKSRIFRPFSVCMQEDRPLESMGATVVRHTWFDKRIKTLGFSITEPSGCPAGGPNGAAVSAVTDEQLPKSVLGMRVLKVAQMHVLGLPFEQVRNLISEGSRKRPLTISFTNEPVTKQGWS